MKRATTTSPQEAAEAALFPERGHSAQSRTTLTLLWCLLGLLLPRALLYTQLAPWGISMSAAAGSLPVTAAVLVGYLLAGDVILPLRYMAAVGIVAGGHWVLAALPELRRRPFVSPLLAFCASLVTGLVMVGQGGLDGWRILLILAESVVAAGGALFLRATLRFGEEWTAAVSHGQPPPVLAAGQQAAVIFTGAIAVTAATTLTLGGFSFGRLLAALLVLVLARSGREAVGSMAGAILGTAMAMADPSQPEAAMALALGGLVAGIFSRFGRLVEALTFFVAAGVMLLGQTEAVVLLRLYEMLAAGVLLVVLPMAWDSRLCHLFIRGRELPGVEGLRRAVSLRLEVAAHAITEVGETVDAVSTRLSRAGAPDTAALFRGCCTAVCGGCPLHMVCWEQHREEMLTALEATLPILRQQGELTQEHLTGWLARQCHQQERLVSYLAREYESMMAREGAWQRLTEIQASLRHQLCATGGLLTDLAGELQSPGQVDVELSAAVADVCRDHGMPVGDALCTRGGGNRLRVDILTTDVGVRLHNGPWLQEVCEACGRRFAPPITAECGNRVHITLTEQPRYRVEMGVAQYCCGGEALCGDVVQRVSLGGQMGVFLSDGMGSGGRAAVEGAMTVGLATRLWQAGFAPDGVLQTVNSALLVKSREESLATLDVTLVDEFTGRLDSYKAGAAASLLLSGGRVSRLEQPSLPVGILPEVQFAHARDQLAPGDVFLLMSDGALAGGLAAVEEALRTFTPQEGVGALAQRIADNARAAQSTRQDDITVVALLLQHNED